MLPAQQRFHTDYLIRLNINDRLIVQLQASINNRVAELGLNAAPGLHSEVHLRFEKAIGVSAGRLSAIKRHVSLLHKVVRSGGIYWCNRNSNTDVCHDMETIEIKRFPNRLLYS